MKRMDRRRRAAVSIRFDNADQARARLTRATGPEENGGARHRAEAKRARKAERNRRSAP